MFVVVLLVLLLHLYVLLYLDLFLRDCLNQQFLGWPRPAADLRLLWSAAGGVDHTAHAWHRPFVGET